MSAFILGTRYRLECGAGIQTVCLKLVSANLGDILQRFPVLPRHYNGWINVEQILHCIFNDSVRITALSTDLSSTEQNKIGPSTNMKIYLIVITLALPANLYAHTDTLDSDDPISQVIEKCESERDSSMAKEIGADKHVESCVVSDMNRIGKLKRYREKYPKAYDACHQVQPYGLSATVICIESQI